MPYKSKAQQRFMHAQHPEMAKEWDAATKKAKGGFKKLPERVKKNKVAGLKALGGGIAAGAIGSALANQIPQNQKPADWGKLVKKPKKQGKVHKAAYQPTSTDPFFNHQAAQKAFDLVMKMDDDSAQVLCYVIASDLLEQEVEENRVTLQKHLNEVISKRVSDLTKATARLIAKGVDVPDEYAQAMEQISKATEDHIPNWEFERKINRDPSSGRFRVKFAKPTAKRPMHENTAKTLGIQGTDDKRYKDDMNRRERAEYQQRYLQIAEFLSAVNAATGEGNNKVLFHVRNPETGETWVDQAASSKPPVDTLLDKDKEIFAAEAQPEQLTVGGAAFSLAGAMGHQMGAEQVKGTTRAVEGLPKFSEDWFKEQEQPNSTDRLFNRTKALGDLAYDLGGKGSKVQLAGKLASVVGEYGPQAEKVLGPTARKTAYRYRGTERTPDKRLVSMYDSAIKQGKTLGPRDVWGEREEARIKEQRSERPGPYGDVTGIRAKGSPRPKPEEPVRESIPQMVARRQALENRSPEWLEREPGRAAVVQYLDDRLPKKSLYTLQLGAGNTPPSEGVIINRDGQITTQAVGYADDHYLPFNLKHLKSLKGGEYIRTRSVGGLTAEDVYTGLISGARRVTVVSRSGVFTMEFQSDFRGGRRHNDKARRMTRRYEHILDAVQSEQIQRQDVPLRWRKVIEDEVKSEYGPQANKTVVRAAIDDRITQFKENPQIEGRDLDRAEAAISAMEQREARGEVSRADVASYRTDIKRELNEMKELKFRLNGLGYTAALDAMEEQFPYYIHAAGYPRPDSLFPYDRDKGYVEPARNRPTEAQAGWYGTNRKEGKMVESGKYSAAHADYQRGRPGTPLPPRQFKPLTAQTGATPSGGTSSAPTMSEAEKTKARMIEATERAEAKAARRKAATALFLTTQGQQPPAGIRPAWWGMSETDFGAYIAKDEDLDRFHNFVINNKPAFEAISPSAVRAYENATSAANPVEYSPALGETFPATVLTFRNKGGAYRAGARPEEIQVELNRLDSKDWGLVANKPLSQLTDAEMRAEVEATVGIRDAMAQAPNASESDYISTLGSKFSGVPSAYVNNLFKKGGVEDHLRHVHQARYLHHARNRAGGPGGQGGGPAGFSPPPSGGPAAPPTPAEPKGPSDEDSIKAAKNELINAAEAKAKAAEAAGQDPDPYRVFAWNVKQIPTNEGIEEWNSKLKEQDKHNVRSELVT